MNWSVAFRALAFSSALYTQSPAVVGDSQRPKVPWAAGENLEYAVRLAGLNSGTGVMQVTGIESMRGRPAWRLHFNIKGSTPFGTYHVDDSYDSWMDVESLNSLRFEQDLYEGGKRKKRNYDIYPSRRMFRQEGKEERATSTDPLDDASFFFFVRTLPLVVGETYSFDKYFDPNSNPVVIKVVRRDTIDVPAGRFPAIVLQPVIKTGGLFSKDGHAELWLSDDEHRILLRMDTHFSIIKLGLTLTKVTFGTPDGAPPAKRQ